MAPVIGTDILSVFFRVTVRFKGRPGCTRPPFRSKKKKNIWKKGEFLGKIGSNWWLGLPPPH